MFTEVLLRRIATLVLISFTSLVLSPLQAAAQSGPVPAHARATQADGVSERYGQILEAMKHTARRARQEVEPSDWVDGLLQRFKLKAVQAPAMVELRQHRQELDDLDAQAEADFQATENFLKEKNLPPEILQRHANAVQTFKAKRAGLKRLMQTVEEADDQDDTSGRQTAVGEVAKFLEENQKIKSHTPLDPNNLPFRTPDSKVRKPKETEQEFHTSLFKPEPIQVAALGDVSLGLPNTTPSATPTPEDLAETEDVQLSQAIKDQAAALHHNPVEIDNWVRNTIEFLPTYGSIQGSDLTLQNRRGNAFDTASLLIALLRASGIPARYVYGTIQLPADQVMNWVGGVQTPEAAQDLLGQGGIPNTGMISGGKIAAIKLEHVWVEAYVDYVPSRGAVNRQGDTWVPMDGSFKQYLFSTGISLSANPPFNRQPVREAFTKTLTGNDAEGWISGVDVPAFGAALASADEEIHGWFDRLESEDHWWQSEHAITGHHSAILAGTLPYPVVAKGGRYSVLPSSLRQQFRLSLYATESDRSFDSPVLDYAVSLPQLAGKRLTLAFAPATEADYRLLSSYLPSLKDGQLLNPELLPSSLPGYLITLNPVLLLNETAVARSTLGVLLGEDVFSRTAISRVSGGWHEALNRHTAGELTAIGLDLQGMVPRPLTAIEQTSHAFSVLHQAAVEFFLNNDSQISSLRKANVAVGYRLPSLGFFGTQLTTRYNFGIPRDVFLTGMQVDVDVSTQSLAAMDGSRDRQAASVVQLGFFSSAMEHVTCEHFLTSSAYPGDGVSSIKALARAIESGQKIYGIDGSNASSTLNQLALSDSAENDIRDAVAAGQMAFAHERNLNFGGWGGSGYILLDPQTGSGAYRIDGGANGARLGTKYGSAVALAGLTSPAVNEKFNLGVRAVLPAAREYSIAELMMGAVSIVDRVILNAARTTALEMLQADGFNFVDTRPPVKTLPKVGAKPGVGVAVAAAIALVSLLADEATRELRGIAIYTQGANALIGNILESTQHIDDALKSNRPGLLHWIGKCEGSRDWYQRKPSCTRADWDAYKATHGGKEPDIDCDEYPPYATAEGGESGDAALQELTGRGVSLRWVDRSANRSCGALMMWFARKCDVGIGTPFAVKADTTNSPDNTTRGEWEKGGTCYQSKPPKQGVVP